MYLNEHIISWNFDKSSYSPGEDVRPGCREFLGTVYFIMPFDVVGIKTFHFRYMLYVYDEVSKTWILFPNQRTDRFILSIYPKPYYNVFLSRGIRIEDRVVGDRIALQDLGKLIMYGLAAFGGAVLISGIVGTFAKSK